jgi:hypothetical protein
MNTRTLVRTWIAFLVCGLAGAPAQSAELDTYGGFTDVKGEKTGFFHTQKIDDRWWLVTPEANGFFGIGLSHPVTGFSQGTVTFSCKGNQEALIAEIVVKVYRLGYTEIRKVDSKHMVLGCYVKGITYSAEIWKRITPYIDVLAPQHFSPTHKINPVVENTGLSA